MTFALCARGNLSFEDARKLIESGEYSFEYKIDGVRARITVDSRGVIIKSRNGRNLSLKFPYLVKDMKAIAAQWKNPALAVLELDGELAMPGFKHRDIQSAIASNNPTTGVHFYAFDVISTPDQPDVYRHSYTHRKFTLRDLTISPKLTVHYLHWINADKGRFKVNWDTHGGEGFVLKKNTSPYVSGHSNNWFRAKFSQTISVLPLDVNDDLSVEIAVYTENQELIHLGSVQVPDSDVMLLLNKNLNCVLEVTAYGYDDRTLKLRHATFTDLRFEVDKTVCSALQLESLRAY